MHTFLLIITLFFASLFPLAAQQHHQIALYLRALPVCPGQVITGGTVAYFLNGNTGHAWGLKANFNTNSVGLAENTVRVYATNIDLVCRLSVAQGRTLHWTLDAGFSGLTTQRVTPPWDYQPDCISGTTPEQIAEYRRLAAQGQTESRTYGGLALATSLAWKLGSNWRLGFDLMLNTYFVADQDSKIGLFANPSVFVAYSF